MARINICRNRMILSGFDRIPPEDLVPQKTRSGEYSFPICGDILRRLNRYYKGLLVGEPLMRKLREIKAHQDELLLIAALDDCPGYKRLEPFQRVGVAWLKIAERCVLADAQGLGKTVESLRAAKEMGVKKCLIVCTEAKKQDWAEHAKEWAGLNSVILEGTDEQRSELLKNWKSGCLICNYKVLTIHSHRASEKKGVKVEERYDFGEDIDLLIADEAHNLRNRKTSFFTALVTPARKSKYLFLITASPKINKTVDVWCLLCLIDPKRFGGYWSFVLRFCDVQRGYFGMTVKELKLEESKNLSRMLKPYFLHRSKSVMKNLPEKHENIIEYKLKGEQRRLYCEMEEYFYTILESHSVEAKVKVAQISRLRQLAVHPGMLFDEYEGHSKLEPILEYVQKLQKRKKYTKSIVFSMFEKFATLGMDFFNEQGIKTVKLTGKMSKATREAMLDEFQRGDAEVLFATVKTGGEGLNLVQAQTVIFADTPWHKAGIQHAQDRVCRIGQKAADVGVIFVIARNTIETHVWELIEEKGEVTIEDLIRRRFNG